ncbi:DNA alkylation repair protein [Dactylosporangium sp. NPDC005572]|uniref:DNA alkylation repair protein n=1 Tax=Dactylosporangium sp. NPDC005572 TaxID=3156889 RepID=UPI0033B68526
MIERLQAVFTAGADPDRAGPMKAYMRDQFEFLGLTSEPRRALTREVLAGTAKPTERELVEVALACWALPEREYQYFACDYLRRHAKVLTPAALPAIRTLITTKSWWDTVDILAANVVGPMVAGHPALRTAMDEWAVRPGELWTARTAILHQLRYGGRTDTDRLFAYCAAWATEPDFFIRKAIGWALREYAKTDPAAVRAFVEGHPALSPLSVREALRRR